MYRINNFLIGLLGYFFPDECSSCGKEGMIFCERCLQTIVPLGLQECPQCFSISPKGEFCAQCVQFQGNIDFLLVGASYHRNIVLSQCIKTLKYRHAKRVLPLLPPALLNPLKEYVRNTPTAKLYLIPVPLHPRRQRERGFNQSLLLATYLKQQVDIPVDTKILKRIRYTLPQATLSREERLSNVHEAFVTRGDIDRDATYILVDDVSSTRATLEECAKVLKLAGANTIGAYVLARH